MAAGADAGSTASAGKPVEKLSIISTVPAVPMNSDNGFIIAITW
jgi:hypothetical protein